MYVRTGKWGTRTERERRRETEHGEENMSCKKLMIDEAFVRLARRPLNADEKEVEGRERKGKEQSVKISHFSGIFRWGWVFFMSCLQNDFRKDPQIEPKFSGCRSILTTKFVDVAPICVVISISVESLLMTTIMRRFKTTSSIELVVCSIKFACTVVK